MLIVIIKFNQFISDQKNLYQYKYIEYINGCILYLIYFKIKLLLYCFLFFSEDSEDLEKKKKDRLQDILHILMVILISQPSQAVCN